MSENLHNESLDNLFKQTFEGAKTTVPPGVWEGVAASTTGASVAAGSSILAKLIGIKGAAILGGVAVITGAIIGINQYQSNTSDANSTEQVKQIVVQDRVIDNHINVLDSNTSEVEIPTKTIIQPSNTTNSVANNTSANSTNSEFQQERTAEVKSGQIQTTPNTTNGPTVSEQSPKNEIQTTTLLIPENICLYQGVKINWVSKMPFKKVDWFVNDVHVSTGTKETELMFTKGGLNKVRAVGINLDGQVHESSRTIDIQAVSANFEYSIDGNSIQLISTNNSPGHTWYINNAKKANNQPRILLSTEGLSSMEIVHIATNPRGCSDTMIKTVSFVQCRLEKEPGEGFSPYVADGYNDEWIVDLPVVDSYYLVIFAPDGSVVFQTNNQQINWNGKKQNMGDLVPVGIYTYQLVYACQGKSQQKTGKIALIK